MTLWYKHSSCLY